MRSLRSVVCLVLLCAAAVSFISCLGNQPLTRQTAGNLDISFEVEGGSDKLLYPRLYINDKFIGSISPAKPILSLKRGVYLVRVELDGYRTWEDRIQIYGDYNMQALHVYLRRQ